MPRFIVKIPHAGQDYYLDWSTIVDAPVTYGMSLDEYKEYYRDEYGRAAFEGFEFKQRMERVEAKGTSSMFHNNVEDLISYNRAGEKETQLDLQGIIQKYIVERQEDEKS
jgi:hypothetical protein